MNTPERVKHGYGLGYVPGDNTAVPGKAELQEYYVEGVRAHKESVGQVENVVPRPYEARMSVQSAGSK